MSRRTKPKLLIADDEPLYRETTSRLLARSGYECVCVNDAHAAAERLRQEPIDLLLTDLNMPGNMKLELLRSGHDHWPDVPVIVVTGVPSLPTAVESVRLGIADYLIKPVKFEVLLQSIERVLHGQPIGRELRYESASDVSGENPAFREIIGRSPAVRETLELIGRIAAADANVLISGESGTGKELAARAIHEASRRREGPFRVIDCTAIPESLFESLLFGHARGSFTGAGQDQTGLLANSDGGTAFFDEIGELPLNLQPKLLRVIQEQTFVPVGKTEPVKLNTRFVCATNRDLLAEVEAGRFRQDLFYRLSVLHLELPPLRARDEDAVVLAEHFLARLADQHSGIEGFSGACLERIRGYPWPGNVRELRNAIESAVALCRGTRVDVSDLPAWVADADRNAIGPTAGPTSVEDASTVRLDSTPAVTREEALGDTDKRYFETLLRRCGGNVSRAAREAGLSRQTLHKLIKKHDLSAAKFRGR